MTQVLDDPQPQAEAKCKTKRAHKRRQRRKRRQIAYLAICSLSVAVFGFILATLIRPSAAQINGKQTVAVASPADNKGISRDTGSSKQKSADAPAYWRKGYSGHGTTHEQQGQVHWPPVEFTPYKSKANYTKDTWSSSTAMSPIYNFTHFLYDSILTYEPALPPGYIVIKDKDTLALGPKVEQNDWAALLAEYWLILAWVFFLLILIILIPFIAVCYCCFCCCRRCRQGCPPCTSKQDARRRCCCGILLLLLIIGLIFGIIIAFATNRMLNQGFEDTTTTIRRGSEDTCTFLRDVSNHIYHLFVYNYEEVETHLIDSLNNAHKHIFLDLADTSESSALSELERILDNMPEALALMRQVDKLEKDLRFYGSQLRDGVRGLKRDINYNVANLCNTQQCQNFLETSNIELIDTSKCIHFDQIPNTTVYVENMAEIIQENYAIIPKMAIERLQTVNEKVRMVMSHVVPPLIRDVQAGKEIFQTQATNIRNIIDAVLSDIHLNTLRSTKSFDDVYEKFGEDRSLVSVIVCMLILLILFVLIIALLCGCFGRRRSGYGDDCCSKATGATCLLLAILLIFCVFSFITLVGLLYFMIGLVTYQGGCAPWRDQDQNALFRQIDSVIDLNRYLPKETNRDNDELVVPPFRMSSAIKACEANQSIFDMLRTNKIYDINDISRISVMTSHESDDSDHGPIFNEDLSTVVLLTAEERNRLNKLRNGNLSTYHSSLYMEYLCKEFTPMDLRSLAQSIDSMYNSLEYPTYAWAKIQFYNAVYSMRAFHDNFVIKLSGIVDKMRENLKKIDELILYENHDFNSSITILVAAVLRSEHFIQTRGKEYINLLGSNLTVELTEQIEDYVNMVITESNDNVGHCAPLSYIYYRGVDLICHRLVDPINGFWVGVLLCSLLFIPILFVAHRLMCLYKKIYPYIATVGAAAVVEGGCPVCTGAPYTLPPILTCGGGRQTSCACETKKTSRRERGGVDHFEQLNEIGTSMESSGVVTSNKSKKD
ncbi:prominin-like protein isoform X3 [Drosophila willistoni]|uniref:prominin-like protein isoform X3 n=1 Tax=Drosophila willistoni TaxID=7260 RepID=UPI000C26D167|nr:prominin-like protein isoform X3 [Drosophila willistoni]